MKTSKIQILILLIAISGFTVTTSFAEEIKDAESSETSIIQFFKGPSLSKWPKFFSGKEIATPTPKPDFIKDIKETPEIITEDVEEPSKAIIKDIKIVSPVKKPELNEKASTTADKKETNVSAPVKTSMSEPTFIEGDIDESIELPPYSKDAMEVIGENLIYKAGEEDTLLDISRHFGLGFIEIFAANPGIDTWLITPNEEVIIPNFKIIPRTPTQEGIIVNLAQMRVYYFKDKDKEPITFPIGIGREGLQTPVGQTRIVSKREKPTWSPTDRMREEKEWLPKVIPAGEHNPLGVHALYLGWPTFLMHGTNKPWAIGRRVSSGCMRMYPKHVKQLFENVEVGTKVTIVNQPILVGIKDNDLYLEANPTATQGNDIEMKGEFTHTELTDAVKDVITKAAGDKASEIKWDIVKQVMLERRGYAIKIN